MTQPDQHAIAEQLDVLLQPWDRSDAPGLIVGAVRDGRTVYRKAFGMASLEAGRANTPATRMRIGSTSKHFASLLLLLLAEEGRLDLDRPIRAYLPELAGPGGDPTLRDLMLHRGGSRCYIDLGFLTGGLKPRPPGFGLATQVRQQGRNFAPGAAMIYNNGGYHLLSLAAERVTGESFEALLAAYLFAPLGLQATASVPSDYVITPGIATMHVPLGDGRWRRGLFPSEEIKGEGAIVSTIDDMLRWARHLRERDRFGSAATWSALSTPHPTADPGRDAYALGLRIGRHRGLRTVGHTGGVVGGSCDMLCLPDERTEIVLLVNGAPGVTPELTRKIADIVLADRIGAADPVPRAADHEAWLGDWWSPETGMVYGLIDDDGALKLQLCTQPYGMDLQPGDGGGVRLPEANIGEVAIDRPHADGPLRIGFGEATHDHVRVGTKPIDAVAFARAIAGDYRSADADAVARIDAEEGALRIRFADGFGETSGPLRALSDEVAAVGPLNGVFHCAITLVRDGGAVCGFRLNSMRTRDLAFDRV